MKLMTLRISVLAYCAIKWSFPFANNEANNANELIKIPIYLILLIELF
jgi:hypothetical protein